MRAAKVEFSTTKYEWAHGRKPRGWGGWGFEGPQSAEGVRELFWAPAGTYAEARAAARAHFAALYPGLSFVVEVCS